MGDRHTVAAGWPRSLRRCVGVAAVVTALAGVPPPLALSRSVRPHNISRPRVTRSGSTLTCHRGRWSGAPTAFTYRWRIGPGAFGSAGRSDHLMVGPAARNYGVSCEVTARGAGGTASAISPPLALPKSVRVPLSGR